jgi:hypothetical protein
MKVINLLLRGQLLQCPVLNNQFLDLKSRCIPAAAADNQPFDLLGKWAGTPLLFTRCAIIVSIHFCVWAILQEKLCFGARRHL